MYEEYPIGLAKDFQGVSQFPEFYFHTPVQIKNRIARRKLESFHWGRQKQIVKFEVYEYKRNVFFP